MFLNFCLIISMQKQNDVHKQALSSSQFTYSVVGGVKWLIWLLWNSFLDCYNLPFHKFFIIGIQFCFPVFLTNMLLTECSFKPKLCIKAKTRMFVKKTYLKITLFLFFGEHEVDIMIVNDHTLDSQLISICCEKYWIIVS